MDQTSWNHAAGGTLDAPRLAPSTTRRDRRCTGRCFTPHAGRDATLPPLFPQPPAGTADSARLLSVSEDHSIKVWDTPTGRELRNLQAHTGTVLSVALSEDSKHPASASQDGTVKIWDAHTGRELLVLPQLAGRCPGLAFSADSQRLASGSEDRTVGVWDVSSGRVRRTLAAGSGVWSVAYSPDGQRLAAATFAGNVQVWPMGSEHRSPLASWPNRPPNEAQD